jgi:ABC-type sugar transport system permease subunit
MTALAAQPTPAPRSAQPVLTLLIIWRVLFALGAIGVAVALWMQPALVPGASEWPSWLRIAIAALLGVAAAFSLLAVVDIGARRHRGRTISLVIDYLGFLMAVIGWLQVTGAFLFTDGMASRFLEALIPLGVALVGYLISTIGDRFEDYPQTQRRWRSFGYAIVAVAMVVFFIMVGLPQGLLYLAQATLDVLPLLLLTLAVVFGLALWGMWRAPSASAMNALGKHEEMLSGWLFLSPNLLGFIIFLAGPLLLSLYFSFTNSDAFNPPDWVGLDNYSRILGLTITQLDSATQAANQALDIQRYSELWRFTLFGNSFILGAEDKLFWLGLRNTLLFALLAVPLSVLPALLLATVLNSNLPGMNFFRAVYFLPSIAAVVGIALVWQWLYNATIGYINYFITLSVNGINGLFGTAIADPSIKWLSDQRTALLSVVILFAWQRIGFNVVLFLAGLQNVPKMLYEAATVDGAGRWARFRHVTLPLLAPTTFFVVTTTTILALQLFEQVFILMNPPEGPNNSTVTVVSYLYRSGFQNFRQGYASAIAWVLFLLIFIFTFFQFRSQRADSGDY